MAMPLYTEVKPREFTAKRNPDNAFLEGVVNDVATVLECHANKRYNYIYLVYLKEDAKRTVEQVAEKIRLNFALEEASGWDSKVWYVEKVDVVFVVASVKEE